MKIFGKASRVFDAAVREVDTNRKKAAEAAKNDELAARRAKKDKN